MQIEQLEDSSSMALDAESAIDLLLEDSSEQTDDTDDVAVIEEPANDSDMDSDDEPLDDGQDDDSDEQPDDEEDAGDNLDDGDDPVAENEIDVSHDSVYIIDGEEVTGAQLKSERLAQADYTRKTQDLARERKDGEAARQQNEEHLAKAMQFAIGRDRANFDAIANGTDWGKLQVEDPAQYQKSQQQLQQLKAVAQQTEQQFNAFNDQVSKQREQQVKEAAQAALEALPTHIPDWSNEIAEKITNYAIDAGMNEAQVSEITDVNAIVMINKARLYDELKAKGAKPKKVKTVTRTTTKKVNKSKATAKSQSDKALRKRFDRTGSVDDAMALLLNN